MTHHHKFIVVPCCKQVFNQSFHHKNVKVPLIVTYQGMYDWEELCKWTNTQTRDKLCVGLTFCLVSSWELGFYDCGCHLQKLHNFQLKITVQPISMSFLQKMADTCQNSKAFVNSNPTLGTLNAKWEILKVQKITTRVLHLSTRNTSKWSHLCQSDVSGLLPLYFGCSSGVFCGGTITCAPLLSCCMCFSSGFSCQTLLHLHSHSEWCNFSDI